MLARTAADQIAKWASTKTSQGLLITIGRASKEETNKAFSLSILWALIARYSNPWTMRSASASESRSSALTRG